MRNIPILNSSLSIFSALALLMVYLPANVPAGTGEITAAIVTKVIDGDTVVLNNGEKVRYLGIDTPERDEPFYWEATRANRNLVMKQIVRLEAGDRKRDPYHRLLAYVWINGKLVNAELVRQGYARARGPFDGKYRKLILQSQKDAFLARRGIWALRAADSPIRILEAHGNARGDDRQNLNDEYITFTNSGNAPVSLNGWTVTDESNHRYRFPEYVLPPRQTVKLSTGSGKNTTGRLYWGSEQPIWTNSGDTVFLFNSDGKLVLMHVY